MHPIGGVPSASWALGYPYVMSNIPDDIKSEPEEVNADQHLGDRVDAADPAAAGNVTGDGELEAAGQESEGLATGAGPTQSGDEPKKDQSDAMDDVDLEPPSS